MKFFIVIIIILLLMGGHLIGLNECNQMRIGLCPKDATSSWIFKVGKKKLLFFNYKLGVHSIIF